MRAAVLSRNSTHCTSWATAGYAQRSGSRSDTRCRSIEHQRNARKDHHPLGVTEPTHIYGSLCRPGSRTVWRRFVTTDASPRGHHQQVRGRGWWVATLFIAGSSLFALGAVPQYAEAVGLQAAALTFFVGSLFFTSAAFLQYREVVGEIPASDNPSGRGSWVWAPHDLDWLACVVQLAGTLWFNWSTGNALRKNVAVAVADQRVWRPDALG